MGCSEVPKKTERSATPLILATYWGFLEVCKLLLSHGAAIDACNYQGHAPLSVAATQGHTDICDLLLKNGANIHYRTPEGITPLHFTTLYGSKKTCEFLLERGARINEKSNAGYTALMMASKLGHAELCETLIGAGADLNADNPPALEQTQTYLAQLKSDFQIIPDEEILSKRRAARKIEELQTVIKILKLAQLENKLTQLENKLRQRQAAEEYARGEEQKKRQESDELRSKIRTLDRELISLNREASDLHSEEHNLGRNSVSREIDSLNQQMSAAITSGEKIAREYRYYQENPRETDEIDRDVRANDREIEQIRRELRQNTSWQQDVDGKIEAISSLRAQKIDQIRKVEKSKEIAEAAFKESTLYYGEHYVQCYLIKNDICVARGEVFVPIQ